MLSWIISLMMLCAPMDAPLGRFPEVARAIHEASHGDPEKISILVALGAREGHFNPDAVATDWTPYPSYGLFQISSSNFGWLGITRKEATSAHDSAPIALRLIEKSFWVCSEHPREEKLAWFAGGGPSCEIEEAIRDSRNRMALADYLLRVRPAPVHFFECDPIVLKHR